MRVTIHDVGIHAPRIEMARHDDASPHGLRRYHAGMNAKGEYVLAHMSDLHLGYSYGRRTNHQGINWREIDGYRAMDECVGQILDDHTVDVVIIAGDLFHTFSPPTRAIIFAQRQLRRLADAGIPVYSIAGNHDQSDIRAEIAASAIVDDRERGIWSHAEPYAIHEILPDVYLHMVSHHLFSQQAATLDEVKPKDGAINLLTAHGTMVDPETREAIRSEALTPREVLIPTEMINEGWDYCLLGHIHERRYVGSSGRVLYNGSLVRRGFSDGVTSLGRGWTKWTLHADGSMTPEFKLVWQRPQNDLPVIDAADMSAADVDAIMKRNLDQGLVGSHDGSDAPILRQRIINISPEKKRSLDMGEITREAKRALTWNVKTSTMEETERARSDDDSDQGGSVSDRYRRWLGTAPAYLGLDDSIREDVAADTKRYIEQGQEATFDE